MGLGATIGCPRCGGWLYVHPVIGVRGAQACNLWSWSCLPCRWEGGWFRPEHEPVRGRHDGGDFAVCAEEALRGCGGRRYAPAA